jgi:gluconolactonase
MKSSTAWVFVVCVMSAALAPGAAAQETPEQLPRPVTLSGIPGVVAAGAKWEEVWFGPGNADGIVGTPDGGIMFAQEQTSTVRKVDLNGLDAAIVRNTMGGGTAQMDRQGRIWVMSRTCTDPGRANNPANKPCTDPGKVSIVYPESQRRIVAEGYRGKPFGRPSDLAIDAKGAVYFTVITPYYKKPDGEVESLGMDIRANGIMLSPDERTLYVTNRETIMAFDIQPDGSVANRREFTKLSNGDTGDGMAVDATGRLYITSRSGVYVAGPDGRMLGMIPTPRPAISAAFSGPDKKWLYISTSGSLAPDGREYTLPPDFRNNAKTIYRVQTLTEGFKGRPK